MKIVEINMCHFGSTGKIMFQIAKCARNKNYKAYTFSTHMFEKKYHKLPYMGDFHTYFSNYVENAFHYLFGILFDKNGSFSYFGTKKLIRKIKKIQPDIIHIHNIHGFCMHHKSFFNFLKHCKAKIVWTFHDCWPFTGGCPHFVLANCEKWKSCCQECPQLNVYPKAKIDQRRKNFKAKKEMIYQVPNDKMIIVSPSKWLESLVKQSFLNNYKTIVINNGIDLNCFKYTPSDFRQKNNIENKFVLLGVAFDWGFRKGLDVFIELAKRLDDRFQIVLVGVDGVTKNILPSNIITIEKTHNQIELAKIYSAADLFINPTREENYPTVNMESIACGTPVITFKTGGSPEMLTSMTGKVIESNSVEELLEVIHSIYSNNYFNRETCIKIALEFDMNKRFEDYIDLFENITKNEGV